MGNVNIFGGSGDGRYGGSILEILSLQHLIIGILVYAIFSTLLIYYIWKISKETWVALIIGILSLLLMPTGLFSDILSWNAGFVNYVPPLVSTLFFIYTVLQRKIIKNSMAYITFIVMLLGQLFLESMTVYQLLLTIGTVVYFYITKSNLKLAFSGLFGTIIGTIIMFSNKSYYLENNNGYRGIAKDIHEVISNYVFQTHFYFLSFNFILNLSFIFVILTLILFNITSLKLKLVSIIIASCYSVYFICFKTYISVKGVDNIFRINNLRQSIAIIDATIMTSFWILIFISIVYLLNNKIFSIFLLVSGGITAGPMFVLSDPLRVRGFFSSYIFLILVLIQFFNFLIFCISKEYQLERLNTIFIVNSLVDVLLISTSIGSVMFANYRANNQRTSDAVWLNQKPFKQLSEQVPFIEYVKGKDDLNYQSREYYVYHQKMTFWKRLFN